MPLTSVNKGQVNGHLPNSWWLITVWNINASFAISGGDGKTCIFLLWLILSEMITWRRKIAISSISDVRTATCTTKGSRCVCTWSKWTMAVVSTAGALVNIYKKGTTQVSVITTCITVFFFCFFFFWQGGNKLNRINNLMLDERKKMITGLNRYCCTYKTEKNRTYIHITTLRILPTWPQLQSKDT